MTLYAGLGVTWHSLIQHSAVVTEHLLHYTRVCFVSGDPEFKAQRWQDTRVGRTASRCPIHLLLVHSLIHFKKLLLFSHSVMSNSLGPHGL